MHQKCSIWSLMGHYEGMQVEDAVLRATRWMMMLCNSTQVVPKSSLSHEECCIQFAIFGASGLVRYLSKDI